jgi:hypothetical protein
MASGWIVEVESPDGPVQYAAAVNDPLQAEYLVRQSRLATTDCEIRSYHWLEAFPFDLAAREVKGPL